MSLRELVQAFDRRDLDTLLAKFSEDARFHLGGANPFSGDYEGLDAWRAVVGRVLEASGGSFRATAHDVLANDDHGVVLYEIAADHAGQHLDWTRLAVHHFREGRIVETWFHDTDQAAVDRFWEGA